jgi:hypothetical protein
MVHVAYRSADEKFLSNLDHREQGALAYAVESLLWLKQQEEAGVPWFRAVDPRFLEAVTLALEAMEAVPEKRPDFVDPLIAKVAHWRNDIADAQSHPLYQLASVIDGDPGHFLELGGPVFLLTMDEVLEGIAHDYVRTAVLGASPDYRDTVLLLCVLALSVVCEACFWATHGRGSHLDRELGRALDARGTVQALRGQLATLTLAGNALAWGEVVEFITERSAEKIATPDFVVRRASTSLYVECTTSQKKTPVPNDVTKIGEAIAHGWHEKRVKFERPEYQPGIVTIDLSGMAIDRGAGIYLRTELVQRMELVVGTGRSVTIGVSHARNDFELMVHESQARGLIARAASALNSKVAKQCNILGIYAHYGQSIAVDARSRAIQRPVRGTLYWSGETSSPEFDLALRVAIVPVANSVASSRMPPVFVQLV